MARDAGHPFEMFDYLAEAPLDFGELTGIFHVVGDERSDQLAVFDFNHDLAAFGHTDP